MKAQTKIIFFDENTVKFFGEGPARLLHAIEEHGALRTAAPSMKMAYPKALKMIKNVSSLFLLSIVMIVFLLNTNNTVNVASNANKLMLIRS